MLSRLLIAAGALALTACATANTYQPAKGYGATGFSDMRIEQDRYRVTFTGSASRTGVSAYELALLRASEVTLDAGYDWFEVIDGGSYVEPSDSPVVGTAITLGRNYGYGRGRYGYGRGGSYAGVTIGLDDILRGPDRETVTLEIIMGRGEPLRGADIYDAADVFNTIKAGLRQ